MRTLWTTAVMLAVVTVGTTSGLAQISEDPERPPLPAHAVPLAGQAIHAPSLPVDSDSRQAELEHWIREFSEWKAWRARWGNRREPGWFSGFRARRQRPDPPTWLIDRCRTAVEVPDTVAEGCTLLAEWSADYRTAHALATRTTATAGAEDSTKTIWWEHVHLDMAWPAMQSGVSYFGVVGMHATTSVRGRLQIFVAPGAMLLNVPARNGTRVWKLATNYGIAYRLGQFRFPGNRQALLHLNLAKAWLLSAGLDVPTKSTDFAGFSITFKKTP